MATLRDALPLRILAPDGEMRLNTSSITIPAEVQTNCMVTECPIQSANISHLLKQTNYIILYSGNRSTEVFGKIDFVTCGSMLNYALR